MPGSWSLAKTLGNISSRVFVKLEKHRRQFRRRMRFFHRARRVTNFFSLLKGQRLVSMESRFALLRQTRKQTSRSIADREASLLASARCEYQKDTRITEELCEQQRTFAIDVGEFDSFQLIRAHAL